ncbi:MAG: SUF system NifU family Fe-S cluster assembly protein [Chloroflexi bacterium]|nr:SUF system NifU family Fe-S cluster assembly protein [Chloroflexota bacterium]
MARQSFDFSELDDLYREIILDHYRSPRNQEKLTEADIETEGFNPFCGDKVLLWIKLRDGVIDGVSFEGTGCSISQASASMLTNLIKGKSLQEAQGLYSFFRDMMYGKELSEEQLEELGEAESLEGVRKFPIRVKCALLSWVALEDGIKQRLKGQTTGKAKNVSNKS